MIAAWVAASPVDLWTTEGRCPQIHGRNSTRRKLIDNVKKFWRAARRKAPPNWSPDLPPAAAVCPLLLGTDRK